MAVKITFIGEDENGPLYAALDLDTNKEVPVKNFYEKSKDKWHIVLGPNSANRKYVSRNEFNTGAKDGEYLVEDKTTGPRVLGTAQPDKALVPFMTAEDKADYDAIIARAMENRDSQKNVPLTEEEKLQKKIDALTAKLAAKKSAQ